MVFALRRVKFATQVMFAMQVKFALRQVMFAFDKLRIHKIIIKNRVKAVFACDKAKFAGTIFKKHFLKIADKKHYFDTLKNNLKIIFKKGIDNGDMLC